MKQDSRVNARVNADGNYVNKNGKSSHIIYTNVGAIANPGLKTVSYTSW